MHGRGGEGRRDGRAPSDIDRGVVKKCADVDTRTEAVSIRLCNIGNDKDTVSKYNFDQYIFNTNKLLIYL
jgi:hypothetical protein